MKIVCSYCKKDMGEREPRNDARYSHGICPDCFAYNMAQIDAIVLDEKTGNLDKPVVVLNEEMRLLACNRKAEQVLGKQRRHLVGLKGGEFLDCTRSWQIEGCGRSPECRDCMIRKTFTNTRDDGAKRERIPALLHTTENGAPVIRNLLISAEKLEDRVQLRIDKIS